MSLNAMAPFYSRAEHLAQLTPAEFAAEIEQSTPLNLPSNKIRNVLGSFFTQPPLFDSFIARLKDIDAKIVLFNHLYSKQLNNRPAENPYYAGEAPEILADRICFRSPVESKKETRCLRTKL